MKYYCRPYAGFLFRSAAQAETRLESSHGPLNHAGFTHPRFIRITLAPPYLHERLSCSRWGAWELHFFARFCFYLMRYCLQSCY